MKIQSGEEKKTKFRLIHGKLNSTKTKPKLIFQNKDGVYVIRQLVIVLGINVFCGLLQKQFPDLAINIAFISGLVNGIFLGKYLSTFTFGKVTRRRSR